MTLRTDRVLKPIRPLEPALVKEVDLATPGRIDVLCVLDPNPRGPVTLADHIVSSLSCRARCATEPAHVLPHAWRDRSWCWESRDEPRRCPNRHNVASTSRVHRLPVRRRAHTRLRWPGGTHGPTSR